MSEDIKSAVLQKCDFENQQKVNLICTFFTFASCQNSEIMKKKFQNKCHLKYHTVNSDLDRHQNCTLWEQRAWNSRYVNTDGTSATFGRSGFQLRCRGGVSNFSWNRTVYLKWKIFIRHFDERMKQVEVEKIEFEYWGKSRPLEFGGLSGPSRCICT